MWAWLNQVSPLKAGSFLQLVAEEEVRASKCEMDSMAVVGLKMEGATWEGMQVASRSRSVTRWQPAKKQGPQIYNSKEVDSAQTWISLEADSSPELPNKILAQLIPWLWPCETLSGTWLDFWPLELWDNKWVLF